MAGTAPGAQVLGDLEVGFSLQGRQEVPAPSAKPEDARSSQESAAGRGSHCYSPADICFGLLRLGSPGLLLGCEGQSTELQQFKNHPSKPSLLHRARWGLEGVCHIK